MDRMDTFNVPETHQTYGNSPRRHPNSLHMSNISNKMHVNQLNTTDPCRVCGSERNSGRNFGVITCSTCKAFFRRNGRNGSSLPPCRFGGQCPVDERTRRQCPTCRLAKCFSVGMQKDLIRTDEERAARLQLVRANRLQRQKNLLDHDRSLADENLSTRTLSSNDWIQITNIRSAYEHFCLYPILRADEEREDFLGAQPLKCRLKESSFLYVLNFRLNSLTEFFRTTIEPLGMEINNEDRRWLIRTNLHYLLLFSSMDLMNINGHRIHFDSSKACHAVYLYVYGPDLLSRGKYLIETLNHLIGADPAIGKLMQIILFLSPSLVTDFRTKRVDYQPSLRTILHLIHCQKQYIDLLWPYLLYRYGEIKAIKLFSSLIDHVLKQQQFGADLDQTLIDRQPFCNAVYDLLTGFSSD